MALNVALAGGRRTVLHTAVEQKDMKMLQHGLDKGLDVDLMGGMYGETPLMYAVYKNKGWPEGARYLIEKGADVNATKGMSRTPLMIAAEFNRIEIADELIAAGADATVKYIDGRTAAGWAKQYGRLELEAKLDHVIVKQLEHKRSQPAVPSDGPQGMLR
jgi:ankyrin repeat protein